MENFKNKFIEIKDEIKNLNPNNESITDSVIAPIFFVVSANFLELNQAIYSTAALLSAIVFYRVFKKQNLKYVFYGFIGSLIAGTIAFVGILSIIVGRPFTIYSSKAFRNWPKEWYLHKKVKPAYTLVAIIWTFYLLIKAGLQIYFYNNPEILIVIKLATSNQSTLILLVVTYIVGQKRLQKLNGPSVDEFINNTPEPWTSQQKGF